MISFLYSTAGACVALEVLELSVPFWVAGVVGLSLPQAARPKIITTASINATNFFMFFLLAFYKSTLIFGQALIMKISQRPLPEQKPFFSRFELRSSYKKIIHFNIIFLLMNSQGKTYE
jgi:hypothetical protein